ncbi:aldose epimerase family protein [Sphingomonas fennica]|uniref:Aldose 1-epimerase n=2 Tax=Sphingomonadales TaxID=204457 RepID=A0A2T4HT46_9SPHN|nr:aldose epimerase family protein [Sphingomonas fennica]AGH49658.1 aldose 1-epimerase [Sphingomonas sp. MM-1]PTD18971.1 galactose-1-epimerase [Sphingomonas fennica]
MDREPWGRLPSGEMVERFTFSADGGIAFSVATYGATLSSILAPGHEVPREEVILGFDHLDGYLSPAYRRANPYFGSTVGRYANRIRGARLPVDGSVHALIANEGPNQLHGGSAGFDKAIWAAAPLADGRGVRLSHVSPDGDQGFPGRLRVEADFLLEGADTILLRYRAGADRATHVNLTSHCYFNLGGRSSATALDHDVQIHAEAYLPIDAAALPTGDCLAVAGTAFDFRQPRGLAAALAAGDPQLDAGDGFNHTFCIGDDAGTLKPAVRLMHAASGRLLEISTTEPGVQFYSGNGLDGSIPDRGGQPIGRHRALCFETQHFPDSPNMPQFPSTLLRPGKEYRSETRLRFGTMAPEALRPGDGTAGRRA